MQTHLKKPRKMALIIDEEILDELGLFCASELVALEENDDSFDDVTPEKATEMRFWYMHKHEKFKRLESALDSLFEQLDRPRVKKYRERVK